MKKARISVFCYIKFGYFEKATLFFKSPTLLIFAVTKYFFLEKSGRFVWNFVAFSQYLNFINKYIILNINDTKITGETVIPIPGNKLMSLKNYTSNWCYQKRRRLSVPPILVSTQAKNPTIYNMIRCFAGLLGQTTCRPRVWCSKHYFFII